MCREQLPVWQELYEANREHGAEVLTVAVDAQGPDKPRPYVERAKATFTTVVDESGILAAAYGFRVVPNLLLIDEDGVLHYRTFGGIDVRRKPEHREMVDRWLAGGDAPPLPATDQTADAHAMGHFRAGVELYRLGRTQEALAAWRKGTAVQPDNWLIRKQIWAVENPGRFYGDAIDTDWQKGEVASGR